MKVVKSIGFVLENTETVWFESREIVSFAIGQPSVGYLKFGDELAAYNTIRTISAEVSYSAERTYEFCKMPTGLSNFEKLAGGDITHIVIKYQQGADDDYFIDDDSFQIVFIDDESNNLRIIMK